ncbi:hypothetical protein ILUMI_15878, partial [Ignelater luminosus]
KKEERDRKATTSNSTSDSTHALNCTDDITALVEQSWITENNWWLDSGATEHMCMNSNLFQELEDE